MTNYWTLDQYGIKNEPVSIQYHMEIVNKVHDTPVILHSEVTEKPAITVSALNTVISDQKRIHTQVKCEAGKRWK